jgi:nucleoside transporter
VEPADPIPPRRSAAPRLAVMMFLQYAVWGVWLPYLANYLGAAPEAGGLGFTGTQIGWLLGLAGSIGAIAAPLIAGQLADRVMNAERALALLLLLGGITKWITAYQTGYGAWMVLSILYSVLYMPTLALTNSVAFANLDDPEKKFPPVRALGTVGWIVASVAFPLVWMQTDVGAVGSWPFLAGVDRPDATARIADALVVSGVVSIGYAAYCLLVLPRTPPRKDAAHPLAFAEALKLLRRPDVAVLTVAALLIAMIHQCYFFRTGPFLEHAIGVGAGQVGPIMALGQISEIAVLAVLGWFLKSLGYKTVLCLGAASYALRYGIFSLEPSTDVVKAAMLLHGMNYGFFFAGSFLYIERVAPPPIRHSAQTAFGIVILGAGPILAGFYNGFFDRYQRVPTPISSALEQSYVEFWRSQSAIAAAVVVLLVLLFRSKVSTRATEADT